MVVNRLSRKQITEFIGPGDPDAVRAIELLFEDVDTLKAGAESTGTTILLDDGDPSGTGQKITFDDGTPLAQEVDA